MGLRLTQTGIGREGKGKCRVQEEVLPLPLPLPLPLAPRHVPWAAGVDGYERPFGEQMAQLTLPVSGHIVSVEVPEALRTTIARDIVIQAAFMRRTGRPIISPRGLARSLVQKAVLASADPHQKQLRLAKLQEQTETAEDMCTDSQDVEPRDLCGRLLLGRLEDGSRITGARWERLAAAAWHLAGHSHGEGGGPDESCAICAPVFRFDLDGFLSATGASEVLFRMIHLELLRARAVPPYAPRPAVQRFRRVIPDL